MILYNKNNLTNWQEVYFGGNLITLSDCGDYIVSLPTIQQCLDYVNPNFNEDGLNEYLSRYGSYANNILNTKWVLPIRSDPTKTDTDGDGLWDCVELRIINGRQYSNPFTIDSDQDGINDFDDFEPMRHFNGFMSWNMLKAIDIDDFMNVRGITELVFTGVHEVALGNKGSGSYHTSIIIFAAPESTFYECRHGCDEFSGCISEYFTDNQFAWGNIRYATIGAGGSFASFFGYLKSEVNRVPNDISLDIKVEMINMGVYDVVTVIRLFERESYYRYTHAKNIDYWASPSKSPIICMDTGRIYETYNSNSFTHGLLRAVDDITPINPSHIFHVPGWDKPLPEDLFWFNN